MYAQVTANEVTTVQGSLPNSARRLDTQEWVMGLATAPVDLQHACGWYQVVDVTRPADDATTTYDRSITWDGTNPTVTWTARPKTQAELDADTQTMNRATIRQVLATIAPQIRTIRNANKTTFSGLTAAQRDSQLFDACQTLADAIVALWRLADNQLDSTN